MKNIKCAGGCGTQFGIFPNDAISYKFMLVHIQIQIGRRSKGGFVVTKHMEACYQGEGDWVVIGRTCFRCFLEEAIKLGLASWHDLSYVKPNSIILFIKHHIIFICQLYIILYKKHA
ncbi:hypothetical protein ACJX0J_015117, partial [Zea mays]